MQPFSQEPALKYAKGSNAARLAEIHKTCFGGPDSYVDYSKTPLQDFGPITTVAEINGEIVGFVSVFNEAADNIEAKRNKGLTACWHIATIDVMPDFRKKGIGAALLKKAEEEIIEFARYRDIQITAEIHINNTASQTLFTSSGYEITERLTDGYKEDGRPSGDALLVQKTCAFNMK